MSDDRRRHVRKPGPFDAHRVGLLDVPIRIYDLSESGCFINALHDPPATGLPLVLTIDLPREGQITVHAKIVNARPEYGYAVEFVGLSGDDRARLLRALEGRR